MLESYQEVTSRRRQPKRQGSLLSTALLVFATITLTAPTFAQKDRHFVGNRSTIVHLHEWRWVDVAEECENFLGPGGYGGVQIDPPSEHPIVINEEKKYNRPFWERRYVVSYKIATHSGNEADFMYMTSKCNAAGVRIYAMINLNDMAKDWSQCCDGLIGPEGTKADPEAKEYPGVPFHSFDFRPTCRMNYSDADSIRTCVREGCLDLDQNNPFVRNKQTEFLNKLIKMGVAGFNVDSAPWMYPTELAYIYRSIDNLNPDYNFPFNSRPFIYQTFNSYYTKFLKPISKNEYTIIGAVTEDAYSDRLVQCFRNTERKFADLPGSWRTIDKDLVNSEDAVVTIDDYVSQRYVPTMLTYKELSAYTMAVAYMLAYPYGTPLLMSSYANPRKDDSPPMDKTGKLLGPIFSESTGLCVGHRICEHRLGAIRRMVEFRNIVGDTKVQSEWGNGYDELVFWRGDMGMVAFSVNKNTNVNLQSMLPSGYYCDIISGEMVGKRCTGKVLQVEENVDNRLNTIWVNFTKADTDGVLAIHRFSKVGDHYSF